MPRHQPPPTTSFPSSSSSDRRSRLRQYASRRRYWLSALAIVFIAVMVVGIIVVAHHYYHDMGGQGYLKRAAVPRRSSTTTHTPNVYLPLRKVEVRDDGESLLVYGVGYIKRSGQDVPFWACGDQQHSCAKFNHPEICCPVHTACYPTLVEISPSEIFCCNSTTDGADCIVSLQDPPKCIAGTTECSEAAYGGCCPVGTVCSPNGCLHISDPSTISFSATATGALNSTSTASPTQVTATITERPASTATLVKDGEVAQSGVRRDFATLKVCLPYAMALMLVCVAAVMGFL